MVMKDFVVCEEIFCIDFELGEMEKIFQDEGNYSFIVVSNDGLCILVNFVIYGKFCEFVWIDFKVLVK